MLYLTLTFWMMIGLLEAFGVFKLWQGLIRPRWIYAVLLPGTIVAETAHFLAALLSGAPVRQAKLVSDEPIGQSGGEPAKASAKEPNKGIPVLSPLLTALLPLLAGVTVIYLLYAHFDSAAVKRLPENFGLLRTLAPKLDGGHWVAWPFVIASHLLQLARELLVTLVDERGPWKLWLFVYLTACLAVRMVPLRGNLRGGMAAIVLVGAATWVVCRIVPTAEKALNNHWSLISYIVALLTLLLVVSLAIRGLVALLFVLADKPQPAPPK